MAKPVENCNMKDKNPNSKATSCFTVVDEDNCLLFCCSLIKSDMVIACDYILK